MSPETGNLQSPTIRQESEMIVEHILAAQARLDTQIVELQKQEFGTLRHKLGYETAAPADTDELTDARVKSMREAVTVDALKSVLIPSQTSVNTVRQGREATKNILEGEDDRLFVIVGPCSVHDPEEALQYADWLVGMRKKYGNELEIIMRAYLEKPRSELGWKGLINDPNLDNTTNIGLGLTMGRMLLCQITDKRVPIAIERVDARTTQYFDDLATYDAIGARDIQSTRARNYLSVTSAVAGAKNPTDGDLLVPVQAVLTARAEHTYLGDGEHGRLAEIESTGNETVHVILRGGADGPNYDSKHVQIVKAYLRDKGLPEVLAIDASHGNSNKIAERQVEVIRDICTQLSLGESAIRGVMIESNLVGGKQELIPGQKLEYGKSITDACIGLDKTDQSLGLLAGAVMMRRVSAKN